jgi:hypothetical protein
MSKECSTDFVSTLHCIPNRVNTSEDVHSFCAGRTLLKDNAYLQEVLQIAKSDQATKYAVYALTASYYKEFLDDQSQKKKIKRIEIYCLKKALATLRQNTAESYVSSDTTKMLLIHHAILNQDLHQRHWTDYLYQLQDSSLGLQANLIIARHAIWIMAILPLKEKYRFQALNYDWVGDGEENYLTKINGILGASRKMLHLELRITMAAKVSIHGSIKFRLSISSSLI